MKKEDDRQCSQERSCCEGCVCSCHARVYVGKEVPGFCAAAVMPDGSIQENFCLETYLKDSYGLIFFYPLDFTFVCPSEIISFSNKMGEFKERNTKVVGISVDSHFTHSAWRGTPVEKGGIGPIAFPLVADLTKSIASDYGVLIPEKGIALRGLFLVDKNRVLQHITKNNLPLGRNVEEVLRTIDALTHVERYGEVCPAGWHKGQEGMKPTQEGVASYLAKHATKL